jgi:hypothetical protein
VNGATIRGEIRGISIGVSKEPEQIIGEFWRHVIDVNPKGERNRVIGIGIESIVLGIENGVVEFVDVGGSVVRERRWRGGIGEELFEGGDEWSVGRWREMEMSGGRSAQRRERWEEDEKWETD